MTKPVENSVNVNALIKVGDIVTITETVYDKNKKGKRVTTLEVTEIVPTKHHRHKLKVIKSNGSKPYEAGKIISRRNYSLYNKLK